jgi:starvation-inducible outer membrane lipoprotein
MARPVSNPVFQPKETRTMMKSVLFCAAAAALLAACAQTPPGAEGQKLSRADREETTGSMLPRRRGAGGAQVINKDQIDTNQILNPGAIQPHVKGG